MNKLTVMAWLAADTGVVTGDLRDAIRRDLEELREGVRLAGPSVDVWAAFDDGSGALTWHYLSGDHMPWKTARQPANMADPRALMEFCDWAMEYSPAEQYALIIGSHGSGPKKQDVYRVNLFADHYQDPRPFYLALAAKGINVVAGDTVDADHFAEGSKKVPAFRSIAEADQWAHDTIIAATADIAYDDGSRAAMPIDKLGEVCRHIAERGPLALVLLDACYMATVEVCEALAGSAEVLVASPEAVPGEGFPYTMLIDHWADVFAYPESFTEQSTAANLAIRAVDAFRGQYTDREEIASILAIYLKAVPEYLRELDSAADYLETASLELVRAAAGIGIPAVARLRASDPDFLYLDAFLDRTIAYHEVHTWPIIDSWASVSAPDAGLTVFVPERGPLPRWWFSLPIASRPLGQMIRRIVEA